jgi:hypothetical protein
MEFNARGVSTVSAERFIKTWRPLASASRAELIMEAGMM